LLGHFNCQIPEHHAHITNTFYTVGKEVDIPLKDENERIRYDANGNTLFIKVVESINVIQPVYEMQYKHELLIDNAIKCWSEDYRIEQLEQWHSERRELHKLNEKSFPLRGRFNNISSVIFHDNQPLYYIHSIGMSAITMLPFVNVRLASSNDTIMVNLDCNDFKGISKNALHKVTRYNKPIPMLAREHIEAKVKEAVKSYLGL
jgi:hypothetical protein